MNTEQTQSPTAPNLHVKDVVSGSQIVTATPEEYAYRIRLGTVIIVGIVVILLTLSIGVVAYVKIEILLQYLGGVGPIIMGIVTAFITGAFETKGTTRKR